MAGNGKKRACLYPYQRYKHSFLNEANKKKFKVALKESGLLFMETCLKSCNQLPQLRFSDLIIGAD
jgi:hypothetical protein